MLFSVEINKVSEINKEQTYLLDIINVLILKAILTLEKNYL